MGCVVSLPAVTAPSLRPALLTQGATPFAVGFAGVMDNAGVETNSEATGDGQHTTKNNGTHTTPEEFLRAASIRNRPGAASQPSLLNKSPMEGWSIAPTAHYRTANQTSTSVPSSLNANKDDSPSSPGVPNEQQTATGKPTEAGANESDHSETTTTANPDADTVAQAPVLPSAPGAVAEQRPRRASLLPPNHIGIRLEPSAQRVKQDRNDLAVPFPTVAPPVNFQPRNSSKVQSDDTTENDNATEKATGVQSEVETAPRIAAPDTVIELRLSNAVHAAEPKPTNAVPAESKSGVSTPDGLAVATRTNEDVATHKRTYTAESLADNDRAQTPPYHAETPIPHTLQSRPTGLDLNPSAASNRPNPKSSIPAAVQAQMNADHIPEAPKQTIRSLALELTPDGTRDLRVRITENAGNVHISLHSTDTLLSGRLQENVGDLVNTLSTAGYDADGWTRQQGKHRQEPQPRPRRERDNSSKNSNTPSFIGMIDATQDIS